MRAADSDDGTVSMIEGVDFVRGASEIVLAAACSYFKPQPLFRAGANREARAYLRQMRLGQNRTGQLCCHATVPGCASADATDS